nr:MAG TPA: hypothetical protein [Caudoviricetes sp.]
MLRKWFRRKKADEAENGLFVRVEDLAAMRRYVPYMREANRRKSFSRQAGDVKSVFKGRGMELEEVRAYAFGDDVRDIDWRVTARKDTPYTKLFAEEKDHEIYVWLDLSTPMAFGTKRELKSVTAAKITALIGWMALEHKDRFGCIIYDGEKSWLFKPQNSQKQMMAVFKQIASLSQNLLKKKNSRAGGNTALSFKMLEQSVRPQAEVFIVSDFNGFDDALLKQTAALARKTQLHLLNVFDVLEETAPKAGEYMAEYEGKRLIFDSSPSIYRRDYQHYFADKKNKIKDFCRRFNCQFMEFRTDKEIADNLKIL